MVRVQDGSNEESHARSNPSPFDEITTHGYCRHGASETHENDDNGHRAKRIHESGNHNTKLR